MNNLRIVVPSHITSPKTGISSKNLVYFSHQNKLLQIRLEENMAITLIQPPRILKLLAHDLRWQLLVLLAQSDHAVQELVRLVEQPQNLVSYHLRQLAQQGIVHDRRSSADERSIYYSLDLDYLHTLYFSAPSELHPALGVGTHPSKKEEWTFARPPRILFLCTQNSARSQMAEAIVRHLTHGKAEAVSAGSHPAPQIHPDAIRAVAALGIDMSQQRPKHLDEFQGQSFDCVVTLCDRVREACPAFPGTPDLIHWSFPDPAAVEGSEEVRYKAFEHTAYQLTRRIRLLLTLLERKQRKETPL
jgi:protein-tyrosine-phosphatase